MALKEPVICQIAKDTYAINEYGMSSMFLLIGSERALFIDTACGTLDLKAIIASLTDKPYDVVLTHNHADHIGGAPQFDEIWVHKNDASGLFPMNWEMMGGVVDTMGKLGAYEVYDVSPANIIKTDNIPKLRELYEGLAFELGGREVEVIEMFGHTLGQCVFLDKKTRMLFSGDACNVNLLLGDGDSVRAALKGLLKLKGRENEFDINWNGHVGWSKSMRHFSMPDSVLDDCIHICESILDGTAEIVEGSRVGGSAPCVRYGSAQVCFDPERL